MLAVASGPIPERVRRLIDAHIHSVEQLEVLLLVRRDPARAWTADEVSRELVTQEESVRARLEDLTARGFVRREGVSYAYVPSRLDGAVDELAQCYATRRVSIISLIFSKPSDAIRTFADAFRLRRDD